MGRLWPMISLAEHNVLESDAVTDLYQIFMDCFRNIDELLEMSQEVHPLLCLFSYKDNVTFPSELLRSNDSWKTEGLSCGDS